MPWNRSVFATLLVGCSWGHAGEPPLKRPFDIDQGRNAVFTLIFQGGTKGQIKIVSEKDTDVDLYVRDAQNKLVTRDTNPGKDCEVFFTPPQTQLYQVQVMNIGPGANRCTLTHNGKEAAFRERELPEFPLKEGETKSFKVNFPAGKLAAVWVTSAKKTDVDVIVYDKDDKVLAADVRISKDCFVSWLVERPEECRVEVVNRGPGANTCVLKHGSH